nr:MAG TPA: hypothetical protein [Bacteriophage sp.]
MACPYHEERFLWGTKICNLPSRYPLMRKLRKLWY